MCGIVGVVMKPGQPVGLSWSQIASLRDSMTTRGPDGAGMFLREPVAFAHRRLAIRDRTGGVQPLLADDEQTVLVYNGELYNDRELRETLEREGYRFRSRCDTEVVLAAYRHWGTNFTDRLRGMFALGIYDFRDDTLLLVRDRFGIKPLFFSELDGGLIFASSVSCLLQHPSVQKQPNWSVLSHYLSTLRLTLGRETVYQGIGQLLPGEMLRFRDGGYRISRYWDYPDREDESIDYEAALAALDELLNEAVQVRLRSDVPVGMFLSGGVDSNTIAHHARRHHGSPLLGQCGGGSRDVDAPDFAFAAQCAKHNGFDYGEVRVAEDQYQADWLYLIEQYRTPVATPSDAIIYNLAKEMKRSVGVVLGGEGADELLCGYTVQHWAGHDFDRKRAIDSGRWQYGPEAAQAFVDGLQQQYGRDSFKSLADHYFALNSLIPTAAKPGLLQTWAWEQAQQDRRMWTYYEQQFDDLGDLPSDRKHALVLHRVNLESLLGRLDTASMQAGLEARVPYTDHQLVEKMFRVPQRHKIDVDPRESSPYLASGQLDARGTLHSKRLLRSLAQRMMPRELASRKKASFPTPVQTWLCGPWHQWATQQLRHSPFAQAVFQPQAIAQLTDNIATAGMWLWPLLNLTFWGDREFG